MAAEPGQSDEPRHCTVSFVGHEDRQAVDSVAMSAQHVPVAHALSGQAPPSPTTPLELPVPLLPVPLEEVPLDEPLDVPLLVPLDDVPLLDVPDDVPLDDAPPLDEPPPPLLELPLQAIQTRAHAAKAAVPNEAVTVSREAMGLPPGPRNLPRLGGRVPSLTQNSRPGRAHRGVQVRAA